TTLLFSFNHTAPSQIYTLSLHDALPISTFSKPVVAGTISFAVKDAGNNTVAGTVAYNSSTNVASFTPGAALSASTVYTVTVSGRSEEHTSELQSQSNLVCRLLLEKKKNT